MSNFVVNKQKISRLVLEILDLNTDTMFESAMKLWWTNLRNSGGLGLTKIGDKYFTQAELEYNTVPIPKLDTSVIQFCLLLDRKMPCPYYIDWSKNNRFVKIYDGRIAVMINLYGDIWKFLNNTDERTTKND